MKKFWMMLITALLCVQFTAMGQPKPPQPPKPVAKPTAKGDTLPPKQAKWKSSPIPGWYIHYDEAVKAAKKANKKIFVLNAGSDWDGASVSLRKSVLDTRDFQQIAKRSLVLLYLDTPQKFPQPEEQIRHHDIIRERLKMKSMLMARSSPKSTVSFRRKTILTSFKKLSWIRSVTNKHLRFQ